LKGLLVICLLCSTEAVRVSDSINLQTTKSIDSDAPIVITMLKYMTIFNTVWFVIGVLCIISVLIGAVTMAYKQKGINFYGANWVALMAVLCLTLFGAVNSAGNVVSIVGVKFILSNLVNTMLFFQQLAERGLVTFHPSASDKRSVLIESPDQPENICRFAWPMNNTLTISSGNDVISVGHVDTDMDSQQVFVHYNAEGPVERWSPIARYNTRRSLNELTFPNPSECCFNPNTCAGTLPSKTNCPGYWLYREGQTSACHCLRALVKMGYVPEETLITTCLRVIEKSLYAFVGNDGF